MDLAKVCSKALVVAKQKGTLGPEKKKVNVLDEEQYSEGVERIIEQDFFPDLQKIKAQSEYIEALEKNDLVKLRELEMRFMKRPDTIKSIYSTPSTFETPEHGERPRQRPDTDGVFLSEKNVENILKDDSGPKQHLDSYLSKNTSEDNESFSRILVEAEAKQREKHAWLFDNETNRSEEEKERLALPSMEMQAAITDGQAGTDTWKYKTRNALMYIPDGEDLSTAELLELKKKKPRKIVHENTRFHLNPWNAQKNKEAMKQAASDKALMHSGKIGHDGKEMEVTMTPKVNGYGFVATPSPAPGVEDSPFMTWGEVEGTPFQLTNETPLVPSDAPAFKIPDVPKRDKLAIELAEKASKQHRDKKENALKLASRLASPGSGKGSLDRINSLSPAAQKLLGSKIGVRTNTDKALRASYTPSPSRRHSGSKTPTLTPKLTPKNKTPSFSSPRLTPGSSRRDESLTPSLTDNLLQIPRKRSQVLNTDESMDISGFGSKQRKRASDYF